MLTRIVSFINPNSFIYRLVHNQRNHVDIMFAVGVLSIIGILIFPVGSLAMDFLLCISLTFSVLILMTVLFIDKSLDFSSFPSILLIVTMLRLALNISTTRLILANGHLGTSAAGKVVEAFGHFVTQGSVVIGSIIFIILTIINFVVITKGSGRIAEVAARFSLDAMPGKQMAIDADLSAGLIKDDEAKRRRKELEEESTFYGAMDGANKFVRGDAIAGVLITFVNFIGGIIIGILQKNMTFGQALSTYTTLTIGDGLSAQVPALIVSISAGLLVTKSGAQGSADKAILEQLGKHPQALLVSAGLLIFLSLIMPGIPLLPFFFIAAITSIIAYWIITGRKAGEPDKMEAGYEGRYGPADSSELTAAGNSIANQALGGVSSERTSGLSSAPDSEEALAQALQIDVIRLELGYELLPLIAAEDGLKLTDQIKSLRQRIAQELGFILPAVRIVDNMKLPADQYVIKIKDIMVGNSQIKSNYVLAINTKGGEIEIEGEDTVEPAFGLPAKWIDREDKQQALMLGYTAIEPSTLIITHLTQLSKENISELLTYSEVNKLLNNLSADSKKLAEDLIPMKISTVILHRILQNLLNEQVSIRDLNGILEAISEVIAHVGPNIPRLTEHVRYRLAKQICHFHSSERGYIPVITLSPRWEQVFHESIIGDSEEKQLVMPPSKLQEFMQAINRELERLAEQSELPVLVTSPSVRVFVRNVIERFKGNLPVLSQNEVHSRAKVKTLGNI